MDATTIKRPRAARRAALILTDAAQARIATLMAEAPAGARGLRLTTPQKGCSGLSYKVDFVTEPNPLDEQVPVGDTILFIDSNSLLYLIGSQMDWAEDDFSAGFVFHNPNEKGRCGCGESFTV